MDRLIRFLNLLSVATADGRLTEREVKFLSERAREWGLSDHQFAMAVNRSLDHPGELRIPRRRAERAELLRDMLRIMASDGKLLEVEKRLFATVAAHMKFRPAEIDAIILELVAKAPPEQPEGERRLRGRGSRRTASAADRTAESPSAPPASPPSSRNDRPQRPGKRAAPPATPTRRKKRK
ncbi:MAG: hypothetical protein U0935_11335 [Pirellulales bacterium]